MKLSTFDGFKRMDAAGAVALSPADVRALQSALAAMLDDMISVCDAAGVRWALGGGSALGALRHSGFIPWDDDLDFNILRPDWPKFRDAFLAKFAAKYDVYEPDSPPDYPLAFPRIRLKGSNAATREDLIMPWIGHGAFIDVFPLESTFGNVALRRVHGLGSLALGFLYSCRKQFAERRVLRSIGAGSAAIRVKRTLGALLAFAPLGAWTRLWDRWNRLCRDDASRFVTFPVGRRHFFGELAERAELAATRKAAFEGREVNVPAGAESYMERLYGPGWRTPPPEADREKHHVFGPFFLRPEDAPPDIRVLVAAHKPYRVPTDPAYLPVHVGAAGKPPIPGFVRDDGGENISAKNPSHCELTALFWAWKNLRADAVGLVHYRRHFKGSCGAIATWRDFAALLGTHDAILPKKRNYFIETTRSQYVHAHHAADLDAARAVIAERTPEFLAAFDAAMESTSGHRFNMFVMKRPLFDEYCEWLFGTLGELERRLDVSSYSAYDGRVFGFVAERLLDVWVAAKGVGYAELPVVHLEGQNWPAKIVRFLRRKFAAR